MMRKALLVAFILLFPTLANAESRLLRHPTYSNGKIAFGYLGDIWVANEDGSNVQRLTVHWARDIYPIFSPDGKSIAFSSNREGNYDVFVIPVEGGKARQLTFHSADDVVVGWSHDGKRIIFQSARSNGVFPGVSTLFEVPFDGGMERPLPTDWGSWASYSPDGSKMAFTRHPGVWSRKHYRGSYAVDLWLMDLGTKQYTKLADPDYKGNYLWPMYGHDGQVYFVADRLANEKNVKYGSPEVMQSTYNIWKMPEGGGTPVQVTRHNDGNVFFPSMSADGKTIVYEDSFGIWKLDVESGQTNQIHFDIKSDLKDNEVEVRSFQSEAETFSLSPSARRIAISTHGEIFSVAADRGEVQRVTDSPWRDVYPRWSPDGKWIVFVSDRSGREELWMADERGHNMKQLTDADCEKSGATWAPDSKSLLWAGSDHKLRRVEIDNGNTEELTSSEVGPIDSPEYSPDGKWISYSKQDAILRSRVYVKQLDGGVEHLIGAKDFLVSEGAKWTADGTKLLLLGGQGAPSMASLNRTNMQLYSVALTRITKNPDSQDIDTELQAQGGDAPARGGRGGRGGPIGGGGPATANGRVEVKIEWDGLDRRIKRMTNLAGGSVYEVVPSPDSRTYAFIAADDSGGGSALYTVSEDGTRIARVDGGGAAGGGGRGRGGAGDPQWTRDGRSIYFMQGGGIYSVAAGGGGGGAAPDVATAAPTGIGRGRGGRGGGVAVAATATGGPTPQRVQFTVRLEIDDAAERKQVFDESWRIMRGRFYDSKMHGVDWNAARDTYRPLLADVSDTDELHVLIMQMIGELNASHTGISGGGDAAATVERVVTRFPGFDLEPDESGYYKVSHIYRKGPADHDYVKLEIGNFIIALNGKELKTSTNYWKVFNLLPGRKFDFTINSKPQTEGAWTLALDPMTAATQANLEYDEWVEARRNSVEKLSEGQVGYLHIKAMDAPSLQKFRRDLLDNLDKKALLIDERFNGGGGIDQELLEILNQRNKYQSWRGRDSIEVPRPVEAFFGPMAVLQNERSASDAEMFPDGFRTLGLGKVIGVPTYGAVIGTGAYRLMDGSSIRTPSFGVYTSKGVSLENYGVQPDVWVDNGPADFVAGHDRQIEKAVEVLRSQLK